MKLPGILSSPKAPPSTSKDVSRIPKPPSLADRVEHTFYLAYYGAARGSDPIVHPVQGLPTWPVFLPDDARRIIRRLGLGWLEDLLIYHQDRNEWKPASDFILPLTPGKVFYLRRRHILGNPLRYDEINRAVESSSRLKVDNTLSVSLPSASSQFLAAHDEAKCVIHVLFFSCQTLECKCLPVCYTFDKISSPLLDLSKLPDLARKLGRSDDFKRIQLLHTGLMQWMDTLHYAMVVAPGQCIFIRRAGAAVDMEVVQKFMAGILKPSDTELHDYRPVSPVPDEPLRPSSLMSVEPSAPPAKEPTQVWPGSPMKVVPPTPGVPAPPRLLDLRPVSPVLVAVTKTETDDDALVAQLRRGDVWRDVTHLCTTPSARVDEPSQLVHRRKPSISQYAMSRISRGAPQTSISKSPSRAALKTSMEFSAIPQATLSIRPNILPKPTHARPKDSETDLKTWPGEITVAKMTDAFSKLPPQCPTKDRKERPHFESQFNNEFPGCKLVCRDYNSYRREWSRVPEDERWEALIEHGNEPFGTWWQEWAKRKAYQNLYLRDEDALHRHYVPRKHTGNSQRQAV